MSWPYSRSTPKRTHTGESGLVDFSRMIAANRLEVYLRPMTLSADEMLVEFVSAVQRVRAKRVVIDSLSGFEIALAPTFSPRLPRVALPPRRRAHGDRRRRRDDRGGDRSLPGDTIHERTRLVRHGRHPRTTYVEIDGRLEKVLAVVTMRGSGHLKEFRVHDLTPSGAVIGEPLRGYHGITTGVPTRVEGHHGSDTGDGDDV